MTSSVESEVRSLVRELIKEVLPEVAMTTASQEVRKVRISTDADLAAFVAAVVELAQVPGEAGRLKSGHLRFSLASEANPSTGISNGSTSVAPADQTAQDPPRSVLQIDKGAVTERMITQAVTDGTRIVLGKGAVLTPLARELARRNNVSVERAS